MYTKQLSIFDDLTSVTVEQISLNRHHANVSKFVNKINDTHKQVSDVKKRMKDVFYFNCPGTEWVGDKYIDVIKQKKHCVPATSYKFTAFLTLLISGFNDVRNTTWHDDVSSAVEMVDATYPINDITWYAGEFINTVDKLAEGHSGKDLYFKYFFTALMTYRLRNGHDEFINGLKSLEFSSRCTNFEELAYALTDVQTV